MIPHKQLTLQEVFEDCQEKFAEDKPADRKSTRLNSSHSV